MIRHSSTSLHLYKQNLKFSAAHFLIFDSKRAERLHGHNYRVKLQVGSNVDPRERHLGLLLDFRVFKDHLKDLLDQWDEHVLLPARNSEMHTSVKGKSLHVSFRDREYVFPKNEVVLLPIENTSVELLSLLLAEKVYEKFSELPGLRVGVTVEETQGQAACSWVQERHPVMVSGKFLAPNDSSKSR